MQAPPIIICPAFGHQEDFSFGPFISSSISVVQCYMSVCSHLQDLPPRVGPLQFKVLWSPNMLLKLVDLLFQQRIFCILLTDFCH